MTLAKNILSRERLGDDHDGSLGLERKILGIKRRSFPVYASQFQGDVSCHSRTLRPHSEPPL